MTLLLLLFLETVEEIIILVGFIVVLTAQAPRYHNTRCTK